MCVCVAVSCIALMVWGLGVYLFGLWERIGSAIIRTFEPWAHIDLGHAPSLLWALDPQSFGAEGLSFSSS